MALTANQLAVTQLCLLDGFKDQTQEEIQQFLPLVDHILQFFGRVPEAVQAIEYFKSPNSSDFFQSTMGPVPFYLQGSSEQVPLFVLEILRQKGSVAYHEIGLESWGYALVTQGSGDELNSWLIFTLEDSGSSGVDGGLILCNQPDALLRYFGRNVLDNQVYVDR